MTSQTGQKIIAIHKLPNISRKKDIQAMKFTQKFEKITQKKRQRD